jgi:hypothetical protein
MHLDAVDLHAHALRGFVNGDHHRGLGGGAGERKGQDQAELTQ